MVVEGQKSGEMTVHEALMDRNMQALFEFLEKNAEDLKDLSFEEKQAEYLRSRDVSEEKIEHYLEFEKKQAERRAESEREEEEARVKLIALGVIKPGEKLTLPATLILGMRERSKFTY